MAGSSTAWAAECRPCRRCIIGPSARDDADVDYTFCQVLVKESIVQYRGNCGNMSSAVGPFAVDEALVHPIRFNSSGDSATVRIFNTNTQKIIHGTFPIEDGMTRYDGDLVIPGVSGTGAPIRLDFVQPGGASTGKLLPTGRVLDRLDVPGVGTVEASLVDAANAAVFVRARDVGLTGLELPDEMEARPEMLSLLDTIRVQASVRMGIAGNEEEARRITIVPFVAFVSPPSDSPTLTGEPVQAGEVDLTVRVISNGQPHRALPLTISLCSAVAARVAGTVVSDMMRQTPAEAPIRLGMPSGILTVGADVGQDNEIWVARAGSFYRTARRLFDGRVWVPGRIVPRSGQGLSRNWGMETVTV